MFNLAALGAGMGQFAEQYRQQQESALRQMAAEFQLNLLKQKQEEEQLLGAVARSGPIPGFGPMNIPGQQQIQGLPQSPAPQAMPQAMPQQAAPAAAQPQAPPSYYAPPDMVAAGEAVATPQSGGVPGAIDLDAPPTAAELARAEPPVGEPAATTSVTGADGITTNTTDVPLGNVAAAPAAPAAAPAGPSPSTISSPTELSQILSMFNQADPSQIAAHIKKVRPDANDGAVWRATATLMKMSRGDMQQQIAMAGVMKFLVGEQRRVGALTGEYGGKPTVQSQGLQFRKEAATGTVGGQQTVAQQNANTAKGNLAARKDAQAALQEYRKAREANLQSRFDQRQLDRVTATADKASADAIKVMARRHGLLKSQIDAIDMSLDAVKPETKKKRDQIFREMQDLEKRIDARVQAVEAANPVTESE